MTVASVLTIKAVENAKPGASRREIPDGAVVGHYLVVQPSGAKSWALRYRFDGKPRKLTIGSVLLKREGDEVAELPLGQPMTLIEARRAARQALQTIAEGRDPCETKQEAKAARKADTANGNDTVAKQGERFIARYAKPRNKAWRETQRQFDKEIIPVLGKKRVGDVTKRDIIALLDGIVDRGAPVTANRILATLRKFFGWMLERDIVDASPVVGLKKPSPEGSRDRILTNNEIRLLWLAADGEGSPFGPFWKLLILTGARRNEVAGMEWAELKLDGNEPVWHLPAGRMKNGLPHDVPLAPAAVDILKSVKRIAKNPFVFSGGGESHLSGFSRAKARIDQAMLSTVRDEAEKAGNDPSEVDLKPWVIHDIRRSVASGMASIGIDIAVIEKVLSHISGQFAGVARIYNRHGYTDEKRRALVAWADYVGRLAADRQVVNVIPLRAIGE